MHINDNNAIATVFAVLIALVLVGAGGSLYLYTETERSANISPITLITDSEDDITVTNTANTPNTKDVVAEEIPISSAIAKAIIVSGVESDRTNEFTDYIDSLNIKIYGMSGVDPDIIYTRYAKIMDTDGYEVIYEDTTVKYNFRIQGMFGKSLIHGRAIAVIDGGNLEELFGYDIIVITSNGLLTTYKGLADKVGIVI